MQLTITPDIERLIQREVDNGRCDSPQQVLENALYEFGHRELDLGMSPAEFQALIDEGWEAAERGDTVSPEEARAHLARVRAEVPGA